MNTSYLRIKKSFSFQSISFISMVLVGLFIFVVATSFYINVAHGETPVLLVELSEEQESGNLVPRAIVHNFTFFDLTALYGDVTVDNMIVELAGMGQEGIFSSVQIKKGSQNIGTSAALNSYNQYNTNTTVTIKKGETLVFRIAGSMASSLSSYEGETPQLALIGIDTDATIEGVFPIVGPSQTVLSTLTIGSASVSQGPQEPGTSTFYIGQKKALFNSLTIDIGAAEPVALGLMIWEQMGSVGSEDIENLTTHVVYKGETFSYPTTPYTLGSNPQHEWAAFISNPGVVIAKGGSIEVYITGDIVGGVDRTIDFVDFIEAIPVFVGMTYGYTFATAALHDPDAHTIIAGSLNVSSVNILNPLYQSESKVGILTFNVAGEAFDMQVFGLTLNTSAKDVKVWNSDGQVVAGPADADESGRVNFTIQSGQWIVPEHNSYNTVTADSSAWFVDGLSFTARGVQTREILYWND